jgi:hypothetical protein
LIIYIYKKAENKNACIGSFFSWVLNVIYSI